MINTKYQVEWEDIKANSGTYLRRAKVPGGWLIQECCDSYIHEEHNRGTVEMGYTSSICFYPDPNHEWLKEPDTNTTL